MLNSEKKIKKKKNGNIRSNPKKIVKNKRNQMYNKRNK